MKNLDQSQGKQGKKSHYRENIKQIEKGERHTAEIIDLSGQERGVLGKAEGSRQKESSDTCHHAVQYKMEIEGKLKRQQLKENLSRIKSHRVGVGKQRLAQLNVGIPKRPMALAVSFSDEPL